MAKKYVFINGVMTLNPEWQKENGIPIAKVVTPSAPPLAVVTSLEDIQVAQEVQMTSNVKMDVSASTAEAFNTVQDEDFIRKFNSPEEIDGGDLLEKLSAIFSAYEIPIGLLKKLLALKDYNMNFIMDDSGSMASNTDSNVSQASGFMKNYFTANRANPSTPMTRWQEAEDRMHILIDMIAYVPTGPVSISFLNRSTRLELNRAGMSPEEFMMDAHNRVRAEFAKGPTGGTPIYTVLERTFIPHPEAKTMHYLFTDGVPSDKSVEKVAELVKNRKFPEFHPLTLISCSDVDSDTEWMQKVEEIAPFVVEVNDFSDEGDEVRHDQGARFPYTRGLWLMCHLVGAINPFDLDALDDSLPLSKFTMDELFGRKHTAQEYEQYWNFHPNARNYAKFYNEFLTKEMHGKQITDPKGAGEAMRALTSKMKAMFS